MTRFAILLGGDMTPTARLLAQIRGARVIAADSGMMHAAALGVVPELWVGDFDSAGSELTMQYREVPRDTFPAEKDATDGAIAVEEAIRRGARDILLLGGLGGQTDHAVGLLGQSISIARRGFSCLLTSGLEEAWPEMAARQPRRCAGCDADAVQHRAGPGRDRVAVRPWRGDRLSAAWRR